MSNVIEMRANKRQASDGCGKDDAPRALVTLLAEVELSGWRLAATELQELDVHFKKYEKFLMKMPNSPEKGRIIAQLANGQEHIQRLFAVCFAQECRLGGSKEPLRGDCARSLAEFTDVILVD